MHDVRLTDEELSVLLAALYHYGLTRMADRCDSDVVHRLVLRLEAEQEVAHV